MKDTFDEISFRHLPRPRESHNLYLSIGAETGAEAFAEQASTEEAPAGEVSWR